MCPPCPCVPVSFRAARPPAPPRAAARAGRPREYDMPSRAVWAVQPGDVPRQTRAHNVYVKPLTISQPRSGARSRRSAWTPLWPGCAIWAVFVTRRCGRVAIRSSDRFLLLRDSGWTLWVGGSRFWSCRHISQQLHELKLRKHRIFIGKTRRSAVCRRKSHVQGCL